MSAWRAIAHAGLTGELYLDSRECKAWACRWVRACHIYRLFRENPQHPSLQFTRVHGRDPIYSLQKTTVTVEPVAMRKRLCGGTLGRYPRARGLNASALGRVQDGAEA